VSARRLAVALVAGTLALSGCTFLERSDVPSDGVARVAGNGSGDDVSANGRFVALTSSVPLVAGDTNALTDVYVHDHASDVTERITVPIGGGSTDGASSDSSISGDGRYVLFRSAAQNLLPPGETPPGTNLFLRDRTAGTTIRVPLTFDGAAPDESLGDTELSANGRFVLFDTQADNILEDGSFGHSNVYVHDVDAGTTERVSVTTSGEPANLGAYASGISGDGDRVVFETAATNLNPTQITNQTFLRRRAAHTTELVSAAPDGAPATGGAGAGRDAITDNGRYVVFTSSSTNLTGTGPANQSTPFVRDLQTGTLTRVVPTSGIPLPFTIAALDISEDARYVLLGALLPPSEIQTFVIDRADGRMTYAGSGPAQQRLPAGSIPGALSADGAYVLFSTSDPALVAPGEVRGAFLRSTVVPTLSAASPTSAARGATVDVTLSGTHLFTDPFVSFGDGTTVTNVAVLDEQHVKVTVHVAPDAAVGKRTALLQNQGTGAGPRSGGLTVLVDALTVT
jgi:hypothetical protein